jgi:hypothetical protein
MSINAPRAASGAAARVEEKERHREGYDNGARYSNAV